MKRILVEFAHPAFQKSRINKQLVDAVKNMKGVTFNNLYENYPDFFIDVKREQQLLSTHDIIVWQHPFYWYSAPALLKEWMTLVLQHGWAYGRDGRQLEKKTVISVISTGGRREIYCREGRNHFTINEFLAPFKQSVNLCRMEYLPPFVVHGAHTMRDEEIPKFAEKYRKLLTLLQSVQLDKDKLSSVEYFNELID